VAAQEPDEGSPLNGLRRVLRWRRGQPALSRGSLRFLDGPAEVLLFERALAGDRILCAFNLSRRAREGTLPVPVGETMLASRGATGEGRQLRLPPHGWFFGRIGEEG
jgi:alpha-glucosidase